MCDINWDAIVSVIGIIVNGLLAWWIVYSIQKKQDNERSIKDHFIGEIKGLRDDSKIFLNKTYNGELNQYEVVPSLKLLGITTTHLLNNLSYSFSIEKNYLNSYLVTKLLILVEI